MKPIVSQIRDGDMLAPSDRRSTHELLGEIGLQIYFLDPAGFAQRIRPLFYALADRLAAIETTLAIQRADIDQLRTEADS